MALTIDGAGPLAGATTLNGLTIPSTGFGKVLQVVRTTDSTNRSTTSATAVDANISVTITPQKIDSALILIWAAACFAENLSGTTAYVQYQITDSSNNILGGERRLYLKGASASNLGIELQQVFFAYVTPASISALTYKGRFRATTGTAYIQNTPTPGQLYAIEVSA